jgi:hypothetical protein
MVVIGALSLSVSTELAVAQQIPAANTQPLGIVEQLPPGDLAPNAGQMPPANTEPLDIVDRLQTDEAASEIRAGGFVITPALAIGEAYDSNVFATATGAKSDFFTTELPSVTVQSEWPHNAFGLRAQGEFRQYATQTSENINNGAVAVDGRIDLAPNAYILAGGAYQLMHEDRGALVVVSGTQPTQFTVVSGHTSFVLEPAPLGLRLDANVDSYAYNNVVSASGEPINEATRDRIIYTLTPRISYEIVPQYDAFVRAVVNRRQYNAAPEADGIDRNSVGYAADMGIAFNAPGVDAGEFYIGYLQQNYDSRAVHSMQGVDFGVNLMWRPNRTTSIRFNSGRSIEESTVPGAAGFVQTTVRLTIETQVATRVILASSGAFTKADFPSPFSNTNVYELGIGLRYLFGPGLSAGLEYVLRHRTAMALLPEYTRQIVSLSLRGQL